MKLAVIAVLIASAAFAQTARTNDPAAVELFRDRGLGLFTHWGVISHALVGASHDYVQPHYR